MMLGRDSGSRVVGLQRLSLIVTLSVPLIGAFGACASDSELVGPTTSSGGTGGESSTSSSSTTTSSGLGGSSVIGMACLDDAECGGTDGLGRCSKWSDDEPFLSSFYWGGGVVGGPANGYCTQDCATNDDCPADSSCRSEICVRDCDYGAPEGGPYDLLSPDKCHGRDDLVCVPIQGGDALCLPMCGSDAGCGDGRSCDYRAGVCVDTPRIGMAFGTGPCEEDDESSPEDEDSCRGFCLPFEAEQDEPVHLCSALCSWGGDLETTEDCGGPAKGLCAYQGRIELGDTTVHSQLGDVAFCTGSCDNHGTCNYAEGFFCFDLGMLQTLGVGYCFGAVPCPGGGTDCGLGEACTETAAGPMCLETDSLDDLLVPLGAAAQAAGGGGAGGSGGN
jgi:hypothetical protein